MQIGDHLFVSKPSFGQYGRFYTHHGIYVGGQRVIHYAGYANGISGGSGDKRVGLVSLERFRDGQAVKVLRHPTHFSREQIVRRAHSRVGEDPYSLFWRNCEHFATWCCTGEERSTQVRNAIQFLGGTAATGVTIKTAGSSAGKQVISQGAQWLARNPLVIAGAAVSGIGYGLYRLWDEHA